jgi:predicted P-loop ATPase
MPILEGPQGAGKTSFFRNLFGIDWFLSSNIDITSKDGYQILQRKWCVEMGEMEALNNKQINDVKKYVSNPVDTYRPSYARRSQDFPRQSVFVGTTNDEHYLRDVTGARRFWPLEIRGVKLPDGSMGVDLTLLAAEKLQFFAEAYVRYKKGEAWHITDPELKKEAARVAEDKRQRDLWEVAIAKWIKKKKGTAKGRAFISRGLCTFDVLTMCLGKHPFDLIKTDEMRCSAALRALGYTDSERVSKYGGRVQVYRRPGSVHVTPTEQEPEVGQEETTKTRLIKPGLPQNKVLIFKRPPGDRLNKS